MMINRKSRKKFTLVILIASLANILIIFLWSYLKVNTILPKINNIKEELTKNEIKRNYENIEELKTDIKRIEKKYNIVFSLEDNLGKEIIIKEEKERLEFTILSEIIEVNNQSYLIHAYFTGKVSLTRTFIELLAFEIIIITLILILIYLFTRQTIFKPVEKIINDIRNYKFGNKPTRNTINNEFDLIQNEFVNLTDLLDDEKKEQTRIIASISHDIKTPLTSIIGYSDLLRDENLTKEEIQKYNEKINSKALHIKEILNSFDDYLVNQDNITLKMDIITIEDLIRDLNNDYKIELMNKNIDFNIETNIENKYIKIDVLKIKRVFSNIISNSVRFLDENGKINIRIIEDNNNIKFLISDNGPGVDEKIINRIFEPLFTTDTSRKISGLGLSICKEFIELHKGKIKAYNNNGLTIEFTIPEYIKENDKK